MLEEAAKNLWLLLTVVVPGLFTYGVWRLILLLEPSKQLGCGLLKQIDDSAVASASIIIAIALLQQAIAIAIEAFLTHLAKDRQQQWPNYYLLFHDRFSLSATGKLNEQATRIIGNFFLSVNVSIGLSLLLLYFLAYEHMKLTDWVPAGLVFFLIAAIITAAFRMENATWAIAECKQSEATAEQSGWKKD